MKIVRFIKHLFRGSKKYEVWDTSALSNHFELFKMTVQNNSNTICIIPEGVSHEISVGRKNNEICKEIYKFIEGNVRNPKLIVEVTPDNIRGWAIDEQVIFTASKYYNSGYDSVLITCDRDQSFRTKLKKLDVKLLPATVTQSATKAEVSNPINTPKVKEVVLQVIKEKMEPKQEPQKGVETFELPIKKIGKQLFVSKDPKVAVYDRRGKRKIYNGNSVVVNMDDTVYYKDEPYIIQKVGENTLSLKKSSV